MTPPRLISDTDLRRLADNAGLLRGTMRSPRPGIFRIGTDILAADSRALPRKLLDLVGPYRSDDLLAISYESGNTNPIDAVRVLTERHPYATDMRAIGEGPTTPILFAEGPARSLLCLGLGLFWHHYSEKRALRDLETDVARSNHEALSLRRLLAA